MSDDAVMKIPADDAPGSAGSSAGGAAPTGGDVVPSARETSPAGPAARFRRAADLAAVTAAGCLVVHVEGRAIALFSHGGAVYAVDNRCPHLGFPMHRGSVSDGIVTCHWHHARFDLASGGTFDLWADDLPTFPVEIRDDAVWVDPAPPAAARDQQRRRLRDGLDRNIPLVVGKALIGLIESGADPVEPFRIGLDLGVRNRQGGWGVGLTIHTCLMSLQPYLDPEDRTRALFHGLSAVARDCAGVPPRVPVRPLPGGTGDPVVLKRWFRRFVAVRDAEGAERCLVTAIRSGLPPGAVADLLTAAVTDSRFTDEGHALDFTNKAFEALDLAAWDGETAELALTSLVGGYASASRAEDERDWRHPIDLIALLEDAFEVLPAALVAGRDRGGAWAGREGLLPVLLGDDAPAIVEALLEALRAGAAPIDLAATVAEAAALRIARFPTSNEFGDWDTAHHTFTFANAVHQAMGRTPSPELPRAVFDAALSVYLDRFLNVPPARLPDPDGSGIDPAAVLAGLPDLLDRRQQVNEAGSAIAGYLAAGGRPDRLIAALGGLLLREDRDFHVIQEVEAACRQYAAQRGSPAGRHFLIAAGRYQAAHAPTARAQGQTFQTALRLARGDRLFEEE